MPGSVVVVVTIIVVVIVRCSGLVVVAAAGVVAVLVGAGLDVGDGAGDTEPQQQGHGELDAVVAVKLQLGQDIAESDAEKHTSGQRQHRAEQIPGGDGGLFEQNVQQHAERDHQPEEGVGDMAVEVAGAAGSHERADGQRIERLVQGDDEEHAEAGQCDAVAGFHGPTRPGSCRR